MAGPGTGSERPITDVLVDIGRNAQELLRAELRLAQSEVRERLIGAQPAMALVVTGDPLQATSFGNLVAGITIMKKGTGTASPQEILAVAETPPE